MKLAYDLSGLEASQADLWLFLRADAICARILTDQAKGPGIHSIQATAVRAARASRTPTRPLENVDRQFAREN